MKQVLPTYVLVANRANASLFRTLGSHVAPELVRRFEHPEGRLKSGEIDTDRAGRSFDRMGGGSHAMSVEESPVERVAHQFALLLADHLERAREGGEFDELGIIAAPRMLGHLRDALSKPVRALVYGELAKDLDQPTPGDLIPYLSQLAKP